MTIAAHNVRERARRRRRSRHALVLLAAFAAIAGASLGALQLGSGPTRVQVGPPSVSAGPPGASKAQIPLASSPGLARGIVPSVIGSSFHTAMTRLDTARFEVQVRTALSRAVAAGQVVSELPPPGTSVAPSSVVTIVVSTGPVDPFTAPRCTSAGLALRPGPRVSEATGQHTLDLVLTNISGSTCKLSGYPTVALFDHADNVLPFRYSTGGDQMTVSGPPPLVALAPGQDAYLRINKYGCDIHAQASASTLRLTLPGATSSITVTLGQYPIIDYCHETASLVVAISPVEPSPFDLFPSG